MVQKIDEALLRRRSEHNDCELTTLKEVSLHQFDIEKIENLDKYCRNLEILYLQANQISKIENLHKLKRLTYLQLSLNNITWIENLSGCESLQKLDLTVNFVKDLMCIFNLKDNHDLRFLFLVGNPCVEVEGYRLFVIHTLPQLHYLDGKFIEKSERISAAQEYDGILQRVRALSTGPPSSDCSVEVVESNDEGYCQPNSSAPNDQDIEKKRTEFATKKSLHTPQDRLETARDLEKLREKKPVVKPAETAPVSIYGKDGQVLQVNQGKWDFRIKENARTLQIIVEISKFLSTSLIDIDLHPTWIQITIKGKILRLVLDHEVVVDNMHCERSILTGELVVTVQKIGETVDLTKCLNKMAFEEKVTVLSVPKKSTRSSNPLLDYRRGGLVGKVNGITEKQKVEELKDDKDLDFVDDPDVPPLF